MVDEAVKVRGPRERFCVSSLTDCRGFRAHKHEKSEQQASGEKSAGLVGKLQKSGVVYASCVSRTNDGGQANAWWASLCCTVFPWVFCHVAFLAR